jgi:hypothetical protein
MGQHKQRSFSETYRSQGLHLTRELLHLIPRNTFEEEHHGRKDLPVMPLPLLDRFGRLLLDRFGSLLLLGSRSGPRNVDATRVLGSSSPSLGRLVEQCRHLLGVRTIFVCGIPQIGRLVAGSLGADHSCRGAAERGIEHSRRGITQGGTRRGWHSVYALAWSSAD